jgi:2-phospho-L-lactate transferase/gluconeogenesis factor (CofD/UPF0052 family)
MTPLPPGAFRRRSSLNVVLFSGGRGSDALARQLLRNRAVDLTVAINGYDDGASTGEVRRFLRDSLGPSDFRKNSSRLATELGTASAELVALLDYRLPKPCDAALAREIFAACLPGAKAPAAGPARSVWQLTHPQEESSWPGEVAARLAAFVDEQDSTGRPFAFSDCSLGNLVFAGSYLRVRRDFNAAVNDYCALLGLPAGLIQNVTDGTNAYLVALDVGGALLASEEAVVDAKRQNRIDEIFLIDRPLTEDEERDVAALAPADRRVWLRDRSAVIRVNPAVVQRLAAADLIIYAPGTQHSSLFPSYLTPGLSAAVAGNLSAIKLLVTNLQRDAEITDASAVDIIDRALYYMREKGRLATPTPCLITHYLMNDPGSESPAAYVPLGAVDALEDPRLVRIGNYEEGVTGRHDAEKILAPYIASLLRSDREPAVAVYLHDADSPNKVVQTLLEMMRGGVSELPLSLTVVHSQESIDPAFLSSLPFAVRSVPDAQVLDMLRSGGFEYVILFESSGMYRGEDIVSLASQLAFVRLDAIWGSRRLSMKDVDEAFRLRYQHNWPLKMASHFGSHLMSVLYLSLFGQYISDTLSGARAVRARYLNDLNVHPSHKLANHQLLTALLRDRSEVLEVPVRFFPISPGRVKRTSLVDGVRALLEIVIRRFRRRTKHLSAPQLPSSKKPVTVWKT